MAITNTYVALDKVTVSSAVPSVTFTSIPQGYTDLVVVSSPIVTSATTFAMRFNSDSTSNYSLVLILGDGSTTSSVRQSSQTELRISYAATSRTSNTSSIITQIQSYSNSTTYKPVLSRDNAASEGTGLIEGVWRATPAGITSVTILPVSGGTIINTGSTFSLYGIAAVGKQTGTAKATGGTIYYDDFGYVYHKFTSTANFVPSSNISSLEALIVAGGGGGGMIYGGGGGAGGVVYQNVSNVSTTCTVTVGNGGSYEAGGIYSSVNSTNGGDSSVTGFTTAVGGGRGQYWNFASGDGQSGGSGGGGGNPSGIGGTGTVGQGFQGNNYIGIGGGGGGANGKGASGAGGIGTIAFASWASITSSGASGYFAGGGGGGNGGTGGAGGGANGGSGGIGTQAPSGTSNTGGGGGGGGYVSGGNYGYSGSGGSGVVILRYLGV